MNLTVFSHKVCYSKNETPATYFTDGGFAVQMKAISGLFSSTRIVLPCKLVSDTKRLTQFVGNNIDIVPLSVPKGVGFARKFGFPLWLLRNSRTLLREVRRSDSIHAPIPGDVGTIGMVLALIFRKPLFVRHCGNWMIQRTTAERFWKWAMERFAGSRNVMFATGGSSMPPSDRNTNIKWIFSTSLNSGQIARGMPRALPGKGRLRLIIACRHEERKGADKVIDGLPLILKAFPYATLDIVGGGSLLSKLKHRAESLRVADRVTFHGKVAQAQVTELLRRADIFCYPTTASEGFPKVVIEALATGLPVITTRVSVLPHLVGLGCGVILDQASPEDLAEAVEEICSNDEIYRRMSAKAIEVAAAYTLENWAEFIGNELRHSWGLSSLNEKGK